MSTEDTNDTTVPPFDEIDDPNGLNQRQQIRQLNNARADIREIRTKVNRNDSTLTDRGTKSFVVYFDAVKAYAQLLAPLIRQHDRELWEDTTLLPFGIEHPKPEKAPEGLEVFSYSIDGVQELLKTQFPKDIQVPLEDGESTTMTITGPKCSLTEKALQELDNFRYSVGLGLSVPDEIGDEDDGAF